jgi:glycosyltransferase involved in cell wall biosynthesis
MLFTRKLLRAAGLASDIFCISIDPALQDEIEPYDSYTGSCDHVLLIHHGIGNGVEPWLRSLPDKKIMVFHNITPADFFPPNDPIQSMLTKGWEQVDNWVDWLDGAIADSDTNLDILLKRGYNVSNCRTIPLLVDLDKFSSAPATPSPQPVDDLFHLLFVGRVLPHKNQLGLVHALAHIRRMTELNVQLTLVGGGDDAYRAIVEQAAQELGLANAVHFPGKVSESELAEYFSRSDLYVSMSRHEGFGMPLIESMALRLPVVAFEAPESNVANTLGNAGILVTDEDPQSFAAVVATTIEQPLLRRELVRKGLQELERFSAARLFSELSEFFESINLTLPEINLGKPARNRDDYRIEGPFDSSYSLAIVNRNLALALAGRGESLVLHSTEGPGDYAPSSGFLKENPALSDLYMNGQESTGANTILRLMYPTRMTGMNGINHGLSCYGWEESSVPRATIDHINCHAHFVTAMSEYVTRVLIDNGANVPIFTTGIGADHILKYQPDATELPDLGSGLRILHVSSCFPRKGVDSLLHAYAERFNGDDNVTLIIKTFPNPHHDMEHAIKKWRKNTPSSPHIVLINRDLSDATVRALYQQCHLLVAPSRGEGFGLPMAEAMLHQLPVVTTAYGGQSDFCTEDTAWLIDYNFAYSKTHMGMSNSVWADPNTRHLGEILSLFYSAFSSGKWNGLVKQKVERAFESVSTRYKWADVANRYQSALKQLDSFPTVKRQPTLGCITSWNNKCGIATYSKLLLEPSLPNCQIFASSNVELICEDENTVTRCWQPGQSDDLHQLLKAVITAGLDQILIQFNFSFFGMEPFKQLLRQLARHNIAVFITFHSTADVAEAGNTKSLRQLLPELQSVARIFVHSVADLENLKMFGLTANTTLFPHGVKTNLDAAPLDSHVEQLHGKTIISSYGFLLPHKGIRNLIQAFSNVAHEYPDAHLLLVNAEYPVDVSIQETVLCRRLIQDLSLVDRVTLITDFLEDTESLAWLSLSSCIVFPYEFTQESSSAAVRWGLTTGKPVYCTPLPIFEDVRDVVGFFPGTDIADIEEGLVSILADRSGAQEELANRQQQWLRDHDWSHLSNRLKNILQSYAMNKTTPNLPVG